MRRWCIKTSLGVVEAPTSWFSLFLDCFMTCQAHQLVGVKCHGDTRGFRPNTMARPPRVLINTRSKSHVRMRNKLGIGLAIGLAVLALAVLAVVPALAQSILPILPPPGHCWTPAPPPGWHGKPPIYLPQIIICNYPIHGQPVPPPPSGPPHPIPLNPHSISLIVTAPPQPPGGCNSLYCWTNQ